MTVGGLLWRCRHALVAGVTLADLGVGAICGRMVALAEVVDGTEDATTILRATFRARGDIEWLLRHGGMAKLCGAEYALDDDHAAVLLRRLDVLIQASVKAWLADPDRGEELPGIDPEEREAPPPWALRHASRLFRAAPVGEA